ncbi:MAG: hypothetical protein Q7Q73_02590 [Verrucomicrobiota bacterium JB024]|nr:hypothetical protein [Verrucomicrobiota bacterium JB024]
MIIEQKHIGRRGVFRAKTKLVEGVVQELSPSEALFRVNASTWLENKSSSTVELLPDLELDEPKAPKRGASKGK